MLTILTVLAVVATPAASTPAEDSAAPVFTISPPGPPSIVGSSALVRTDRGVSVTLETTGLEPGHVVTLWWIVANTPDDCEEPLPGLSRCGPGDHVGGRGEMSVHHATGRLIHEDGTASFGAHLRVGDTSRVLFEGDPGLLDPREGEVILVLRTHGPRIPQLTAEMLHTFIGGCEDEQFPPQLTPIPDVFGPPGPNEGCTEIQVSVHNAA